MVQYQFLNSATAGTLVLFLHGIKKQFKKTKFKLRTTLPDLLQFKHWFCLKFVSRQKQLLTDSPRNVLKRAQNKQKRTHYNLPKHDTSSKLWLGVILNEKTGA